MRELILAADDIKREEVDLPEWGCKVVVRTMNAEEYGLWWPVTATKFVRESLCIHSTVDADGNKVFLAGEWKETEADGEKQKVFEPADETILAGKAHPAFHRLYLAAARVNAFQQAPKTE